MKITKLEIEMTADEKRVWDSLAEAEGTCSGVACATCPFDTICVLNSASRKFLTGVANVKLIQPPLVLTEGMDCRGLQLRSGNQVLGVFKCTNKLLMVVYRTLGDLTDFVHSLPNGRNNDMVGHGNSTYDVIRKEA